MNNKAIMIVGEEGASIELPNGQTVTVGRKDDSVTAATIVLEALGIEVGDSESENEIELAKWIHDKMCRDNHDDRCSWFYEQDDWTKFIHMRYLEKARKLLEVTDAETAKAVIEIVK